MTKLKENMKELLEKIKGILGNKDLLEVNKNERSGIDYDRLTIQLLDNELWVVAHENGWHENDIEDKIDTLEKILKL